MKSAAGLTIRRLLLSISGLLIVAWILCPSDGALAAESKSKAARSAASKSASSKSTKTKAAKPKSATSQSTQHRGAKRASQQSAKVATKSGKRSAGATSRKKSAKSGNARLRAQAKARRAARKDYHPPSAAIVVDANSGRDLLVENAEELRHPASLTKVMTLYLLFEQLDAGKLKISDPLSVSSRAAAQPPTKLRIKPGETLTVEQAIKALVTRSANDAAVVIAEGLGGTVEGFAAQMTAKARALGMKDTVYFNPSGLPNPAQVTTARDQAILARAIQDRFPQYYPYFSTRTFHFRGKTIGNHNHLLGSVAGVDGIKTGYTFASGYNLTTSMRRGGRHLVAVVLGGRSAGARDAYMRKIIEQHVGAVALVRTAPKVVEMIAVAQSWPVETVPQPSITEAVTQDETPTLDLASVTTEVEIEATTAASPSLALTAEESGRAAGPTAPLALLFGEVNRVAPSDVELRPTQRGSESVTAQEPALPEQAPDDTIRVRQTKFALAGTAVVGIPKESTGRTAAADHDDERDEDESGNTGTVAYLPVGHRAEEGANTGDTLDNLSGPIGGMLAGMFAGLIGFQAFRRGNRRRFDLSRR